MNWKGVVSASIFMLFAGMDIFRLFNGDVDGFFHSRWVLGFGTVCVFIASIQIMRSDWARR